MEQIAEGLHVLRSRPRFAFNSYLVGDVLADAATRWAGRRILRELGGHAVRAHWISHPHSDHQGASKAVTQRLGIPVWTSVEGAPAIRSGDLRAESGTHLITRLQHRVWAGPAVPVARELREGDELAAGFVVLETPGHAPAHTSLWREADRTLIAFDVLFGRHPITGRRGLHEPPEAFTLDPAENRRQIRRLAALEPATVLFGHGPPLRDAAGPLGRFAASLAR